MGSTILFYHFLNKFYFEFLSVHLKSCLILSFTKAKFTYFSLMIDLVYQAMTGRYFSMNVYKLYSICQQQKNVSSYLNTLFFFILLKMHPLLMSSFLFLFSCAFLCKYLMKMCVQRWLSWLFKKLTNCMCPFCLLLFPQELYINYIPFTQPLSAKKRAKCQQLF